MVRNILTIMGRDLRAYFTSPIGYMFMVVFLLISVGLYITAFFAFPIADMRAFFGNLPIMLCVFMPAVTMRIWAEERKENTWELLLTFPMKASELVLGKFFASFVFFAITLASTVTVPLMLIWLGDPDMGAIFGAYFGTLLLGAFFLALGIFFSAFCRDQIVAFVVTLLACFAIFLLGTNFIASYIDGIRPGLGTLLADLVGVIDHYNAFTRGVVDMVDIFYFLGWTVLLLFLNIMYIDVRNRPGGKTVYTTALVLCAAIGFMFNWAVTGQSFGRFDLTDDKSYTMSEASTAVLSRLQHPVKVNIYITPKAKMPTEMASLEQDITDKLDELRVASGGKLQYAPVYLEAANVVSTGNPFEEEKKEDEGDQNKKVEERMLDKGVRPFATQSGGSTDVSTKLVYSSVGIAYQDKTEEIIPQVMPRNLQDLEYRLVSTIYKMSQEKAPVVALFAPKESMNIPPQQRMMMQQLGQPIPEEHDPYSFLEKLLRSEKYDVRRIALTKEEPLPDEYDVLVVVQPRDINERQRFELSRAIASGKPVVIAVQMSEWDYQTSRRSINVTQRKLTPGINELIEQYGVKVSGDILMDVNSTELNISSGNSIFDAMGMSQPLKMPTHMLLTLDSMNKETAITGRLEMVLYLWGAALELAQDKIKDLGLTAKVLMHSTPQAWTVPADAPLTDKSFDAPTSGTKEFPLMAQIEGQFPDVYKDKPAPAWPPAQPMPGMPPEPAEPESSTPAPITPAPGKLLVLGCAQMFRDEMIRAVPSNLDLFMNSVDALALSDDLVNVRGKKPMNRLITLSQSSEDNAKRTFWKSVNYGLMPLLIAVAGIGILVLRRQTRNAYTMHYARGEQAN
jgi:ABC-2 type transport system permease protein